MKDLHSKWGRPIGEKCPFAGSLCSRYNNPEFDQLVDQMEASPAGTPDSPTYVALANKALDIYLRDMPEIMLTEELHVVTFNDTYWKGLAERGRPLRRPLPPVGSLALIIHKIQPVK